MIGSVSFSGTQGTNFQDLISKPQAYTGNDTPSAASGVSDSFEKKKSSVGKKIGIGVAIAAAVAGALALGHKTGISKSIPKVGEHIDKAGETITKYAKSAVAKAQEGIATIKEKIKPKEIADDISDIADDIDDFADDFLDDIAEAATETVKDSI